MRLRLLLAFFLVASLQAVCQGTTAIPPTATLPKDPRALLEAARLHYNFSDATLKPWRLKATYQLYDSSGIPTEHGTWEYWWASPQVHRSSIVREGASRTEWTASDHTIYRKDDGAALKYLERNLDTFLLYQFPQRSSLDSGKAALAVRMVGKGPSSTACVTSTRLPAVPLTVPRYYCFDPVTLALIETYLDSVDSQYSQFVTMGEHYFPRQTTVRFTKQNALTISVETIDIIDAANPALTPAPDAVPVHSAARHGSGPDEMKDALLKKSFPIYPRTAKEQRIQGTVVLGATIGTDGKIRNLEVLYSPSPLLTDSAVDSVKTWEYKPYVDNGGPVEVETTINVIYTISG